jgi:hypothetical protein
MPANYSVSPGMNPARIQRPTTTDWSVRQLWQMTTAVPVAPGDASDANNPADPANAGHAQFLKMDPRADLGAANPRNPNSSNYDVRQPFYNAPISSKLS